MVGLICLKELMLTKPKSHAGVCNDYYFLKVNFRFQPKTCNGCHDLMQKAMSFNDAPIHSVKWKDYRIEFCYVSKDEAINLLMK